MANAFEELEDDLRACIEVRDKPLLIGPPGTGKTSLVLDLCRKMGLKPYILIGSLCDPTDVAGFPVVDADHYDGKTTRKEVYLAPRVWMTALNNSKGGGALILDEITGAPPAVQSSLLTGVQSGQFGDYQLDLDRVAIMAACNPPEQTSNGQELSPAMASRFTWFDFPMASGAKAFVEWFPGYGDRPPVVSFLGRAVSPTSLLRARSLIAGFLTRKPELWHQMPAELSRAGQWGWPCSRSWERVSWHLARAIDLGVKVITCARRIAGAIGEAPAGEFNVYVRETDLPDPETLLADPDAYRATGRVDIDFSVISSVAAAVLGNVTAARFLAGLKIVAAAINGKANGQPAYEAGMFAMRKFNKVLTTDVVGGKIAAELGNASKVNKYVQQCNVLLGPAARDLAKALEAYGSIN